MATKELLAIVQAREAARQQGQPAAMVTIYQTAGSTYRRAGARMLVLPAPAGLLGSISGGCLEDDARERAREVLSAGRSASVVYDTTAEADILFGSGVGCQGIVRVLIQPLPSALVDAPADPLTHVARALHERRTGVLASVCTVEDPATETLLGAFLWLEDGASEAAGTLLALDARLSATVRADAQTVLATGRPALRSYPVAAGGRVEIFLDAVQPPRSLLVCGAGEDAAPLAHLAKDLGWRVRVVDGRRAYALPTRFPDVDELIVCPPREFAARGHRIEAGESVVLMTHNFSHDKEFLRAALASPARYIGVLGPRRRTARLLSEMADLPGVPLGARSLRRVHGPAGLDIGAEAPEQIALAIVAEIQAVASRRRGGLLKRRRSPLHEPISGTRVGQSVTM